jgi:NADPH:quinone reductase-like Zn-dependent oxidoreductase
MEIAKMMADGKVKAVIQSTYPFEEAPKAFEELKTGRTRGKIVVRVADASAILK